MTYGVKLCEAAQVAGHVTPFLLAGLGMDWLTTCTAGPVCNVRRAAIPVLSSVTNACFGPPRTPDCIPTFAVLMQASIAQLQAEQKAAQEGKQQLQQTASAYTAEIQELQQQLQCAQQAQQQQQPEVSFFCMNPGCHRMYARE